MADFLKTKKQHEAIKILSEKMYTLLDGGSRSGKTFIFLYAIVVRALKEKNSRHLIVRHRFNHVKSAIWYDSFPKLMKVAFPSIPWTQNKSDWFIEFPNRSQIWFGGLDSKERTEKILGNEYSTIYFNESSQIDYQSYLIAITRLAQKNGLQLKGYIDCNPPNIRHWLYSLFILHVDPTDKTEVVFPDLYGRLSMNPVDNEANIPPEYIDSILSGLSTRQRQRFRDGIWLSDAEGALWNSEMISDARILKKLCPNLMKIVVAVDPAVSCNPNSAETGIVTAGKDDRGHYYVLADDSLKGTSYKWALETVSAFDDHEANIIIGEVNNGGDLIEANIRSVDKTIPYKSVRATRGKYLRAEPIATLYEQGKVHHVGIFNDLEDQMCSWAPDSGEPSPDRLDALVWALTELSGTVKTAGTF